MVEDSKTSDAIWKPVRFRNGSPEGEVVTFMDVNTGELRSERDPDVIAQLQNDPNYVTTEQQLDAEVAPNPGRGRAWRRATDSSNWFVEQHMGLGVVRALRAIKSHDDEALLRLYRDLPAIDFSRHIATGQEHRLAVMAVPRCGWSDLGTPHRLAQTLARQPRRSASNAAPAASKLDSWINLAERLAQVRPAVRLDM